MRRFIIVLEWLLRHLLVYPFFRLVFRNQYSDDVIDVRTVKKMLILRFDRIGDMIVTTPIFKALKKRNPELHIAVFTSHANAEIISKNSNVNAIYILERNWWRLWEEIRRARKEQYDVVLNFIFNRTTSAGILANLAAPRAFKVGQGAEKYKFYFNRLLQLERTELHMVEVLARYIELVFGFTIAQQELQFEILIDSTSQQKVDQFLVTRRLMRRQNNAAMGNGYVVLNISATDAVRQIRPEQVVVLSKHLISHHNCPVIMISAPSERELLERIRQQIGGDHCFMYPEQGNGTLLEIASLIEGASCVFTPDTSIIHFASAMRTPVLGLFTPLQMAHEWVPYNVQHAAVYAPAGKSVSEISTTELMTQADRFLATLDAPKKEYAG